MRPTNYVHCDSTPPAEKAEPEGDAVEPQADVSMSTDEEGLQDDKPGGWGAGLFALRTAATAGPVRNQRGGARLPACRNGSTPGQARRRWLREQPKLRQCNEGQCSWSSSTYCFGDTKPVAKAAVERRSSRARNCHCIGRKLSRRSCQMQR